MAKDELPAPPAPPAPSPAPAAAPTRSPTPLSGAHAHADGTRHRTARRLRRAAADIAFARPVLATATNGEKDTLQGRPASFHKGLPHDACGLPDRTAYAAFVEALKGDAYAAGDYAPFDVPLGPIDAEGAWPGGTPGGALRDSPSTAVRDFSTVIADANGAVMTPAVRNWESPLAGHQFDLQGPDAGDLAMAPVPKLGSSELTAELAEIYAMAVLRDTSFEQMRDPTHLARGGLTVGKVVEELAALPWFDPSASVDDGGLPHRAPRRAARLVEPQTGTGPAALDATTLFRGSVPGAKVGPYVSQFLLIGNGARGADASTGQVRRAKDARNVAPPSLPGGQKDGDHPAGAEDGYVTFGAQRIDQRVNTALAGRDYMTDWPLWLDAQNGADLRGQDAFEPYPPRFIGTPRDLATYVHFDELYQAYFGACLLMFAYRVPFDFGFPSGRGHATRGSFATHGGPHVLSLLTEVASRTLKAVRRQKFQHHLRGRPEQLAGMVTLAASAEGPKLGDAKPGFDAMLDEMRDRTPMILKAIARINAQQNTERHVHADIFPRTDEAAMVPAGSPTIAPAANLLLPMAFPEGSPMHAAYGAGHASVAGACVTILKAFFEMSKGRVRATENGVKRPLDLVTIKADPQWFTPAKMDALMGLDAVYVADDATERCTLKVVPGLAPSALTIEGELNKLAANVAIGRNMAGVHYYTDYYDSVRMGERLAVGILQEQAVTYCDAMTMRLTSFDGDHLIVEGDGEGGAKVHVRPGGAGSWEDAYEGWWGRHA